MASTWVSVGPLPSNDKVYKGLKVSIRPYQFAEVRAASRSQVPPEERMSLFASGMRCNNDFDPMDMTLQDFLYVAALRVMLTMGDKTRYAYSAPPCKCGEPIRLSVTGDEFEFQDLETDFPLSEKVGDETYTVTPITARQYLRKAPQDEYEMLAIACKRSTKEIKEAEDFIALEAIDNALQHSVKPLLHKCKKCDQKHAVGVTLLGQDGTNSLVVPFR